MKDNKMDLLLKQLEDGVKSVFEEENFKKYLAFASKFTKYSLNNQILIWSQKPEATLCAGFQSWKDFGRKIKKGEKGIRIISPMPYKVEDENGEEIERLGFKSTCVFDMSQTEGDTLPVYDVSDLIGNVPDYLELVGVLRYISDCPIYFDELKDTSAKGYYSPLDNEIFIKEGMSQAQTLKTIIHEMAHSLLHADADFEKSRSTKEVEAEAIAFCVASYLNLDTSDYSFKYIATWSSDKETKELKNSLGVIRNTSNLLIKRIDQHLMDIRIMD